MAVSNYTDILNKLKKNNILYLFSLEKNITRTIKAKIPLQEYIDTFDRGYFDVHARYLYRTLKNIGLINLNNQISTENLNKINSLNSMVMIEEYHLNYEDVDFLVNLNNFYNLPFRGYYDISDLFMVFMDNLILKNKEIIYLHLLNKYILNVTALNKENFYINIFNYLVDTRFSSLDDLAKKNILISFLKDTTFTPNYIKDILNSSTVLGIMNQMKFYVILRHTYTDGTLLTRNEILNIKNKQNYEVFFDKYSTTDILIKELFHNLRLDK